MLRGSSFQRVVTRGHRAWVAESHIRSIPIRSPVWCIPRSQFTTTRPVLFIRERRRIEFLDVVCFGILFVGIGPFLFKRAFYSEIDLKDDVGQGLEEIEKTRPDWRKVKAGGDIPLHEVFDYSGQYPSRAATVFQHGDRVWKLESAVVGKFAGDIFEKTMVWRALPPALNGEEKKKKKYYLDGTETITMIDSFNTSLPAAHESNWEVERSFSYITKLSWEEEGSGHPLVHTITSNSEVNRTTHEAEVSVQLTTIDYAKNYSRLVTYKFTYPGPGALPIDATKDIHTKWRNLFSEWASSERETQE